MTRPTGLIACIAIVAGTQLAHAETKAFPKRLVPGRAVVKIAGVNPEQIDAAMLTRLNDIAKDSHAQLELIRPLQLGWGLYSVRAQDGRTLDETETQELVNVIAAHPFVTGITVDKWLKKLVTPNDPKLNQMWHLSVLGAVRAWDTTTGNSNQRIAVVDTGTIRAHEDLSGKDLAGYDFISDSSSSNDGNGRDSNYDDSGDGGDCGYGYEDDSWHGTHVAGTILATANNGKGIAGVNWQAKLVTVRVLGQCGGSLTDIMEGSVWAAGGHITGVPDIGANKVSVMNLSLGGGGSCSSYEQDMINDINARGVIFVAAAGNSGGGVESPGNCTGVVTVAAHGRGSNRPRTSYSSFGSSVEIVAPGGETDNSYADGVLSSIGPGNNGYDFYQGTSMATPHVAGAISLMQALDPTLTRSQIVQLMQTTGVACGNCDGKKALQLDALLEAVTPTVPQEEPPPVEEPPVEPTPTDDDLEDNDTFATAKPVNCGVAVALTMAAGDEDWFKITPTSNQRITVLIDGATDADLDLFLARGDAESDTIVSSRGLQGDEQVEWDADGSVVGIAVKPWENASGDYMMSVTCETLETPPPVVEEPPPVEEPETLPDSVEPNDSYESATPVDCFTQRELVASINDQDWLVLDVPNGTLVTTRIQSDAAAALSMRIMTHPSQPNLASKALSNGSAEAQVTAPGRLAIAIQGSATRAHSYRVIMSCQTPPPANDTPPPPTGATDDQAEPNDVPAQAFRLECNQAGSFIASNNDVFVIALNDKDDLELRFKAQGAELPLAVIDPTGELLDELRSTGLTVQTNQANLAGGDYLLSVTPPAALSVPYDIEIRCTPHTDTGTAEVGGCKQAKLETLWPAVLLALLLMIRRRAVLR